MKTDNGFGLIVSVFVILILSLLMFFSTSMFSTDIEISLDSLRSTQALFLGEGAIRYCIKHELINDPDWSDNADTINKPLGRGVFSIYYDSNHTTAIQTTIRVVATVDDITRNITQNLKSGGWPEKDENFPYSLFTAGDLSSHKSPSISIEEPYRTNDPGCPNIDCNFDYYYKIADVRRNTDWFVKYVYNQEYKGIYLIKGDLYFLACKNITFYGSIIATGDITFNGCQNVKIIPSGNHPALVSGSHIVFTKYDLRSANIDIQGPMFSEDYILIHKVDNFRITGLMYAESYIHINRTNNFISKGSLIALSYIRFYNCGPEQNVKWDSKVLDEPPGFTWIGVGGSGVIMGTWDESL